MSGFQLNGWQRIGIVLSVVWLLVGALWGWMWWIAPYRDCVESAQSAASVKILEFCERHHRWVFDDAWLPALLVAVVPIPIAWLIVYIVIWLVRWIRLGFTAKA
jgi:hypothetical protein